MKTSNYSFSKLIHDRKALIFCLFILFANIIYLYKNDDNYFIFGYGYGLEKILNLNTTPNPIIDVNGLFLRAFSYLGNLMVFNFIFLMVYNLVFKLSKSNKIETLFVYIINILLILVIMYLYTTISL